jgi:hypothetical protein
MDNKIAEPDNITWRPDNKPRLNGKPMKINLIKRLFNYILKRLNK